MTPPRSNNPKSKNPKSTTPKSGQSRRAAAAAARRRRERRRRYLRIGTVVAGVALGAVVVAVVLSSGSSSKSSKSSSSTTVPIEGVKSFRVTGRDHVEGPVRYPQTPPVGGNHNPIWQNCGFYSQPVPTESGVHSLEHGAVWITYRPGLPADQVDDLRAIAKGNPKVLVSPFPDLPAPVVASSWGRQLQLDSANDPRLAEFVHRFVDSKEAPERGGLCSGANGTPEG